MEGPYLNTSWSEWYRKRIPAVLLLGAAGFLILFLRLYQLQILRGHDFRQMSEENRIRPQSLAPPRGLVKDRNGLVLAGNRPSFDVTVIPRQFLKDPGALPLLAEALGLPLTQAAASVEKARSAGESQPQVIAEDIGRDRMAVLSARRLELPGVSTRVGFRRHYPMGSTAAHVVGYMAQVSAKDLRNHRHRDKKAGDFIGRVGVEKRFEGFLSGRRGTRQVEVDARGRVVSVLHTVPALPGKNVVLTLDADLQMAAERLLGARAGAVVAIAPETGKVLVLASSPAFEPEAFAGGMSRKAWEALSSNPDRPMQDKAVAGEYPPGSVYKIITAMASLEEKVAVPATEHYCPGYYEFGDRSFLCWKKQGHGSMGILGALAQSCDVYFYKVGEKLGVNRLAFYASRSGMGSAPGLGLSGEGLGLVPTTSWKKNRLGRAWMGGETLAVAIGQGYNLITPIQAACLTAAVANGGPCGGP